MSSDWQAIESMSEFNGYLTERDDVLDNKFGIADPAVLKEVEAEIVAMRMAELLSSPARCPMTFDALKTVHYKLFGDLYDMAGITRTVDIAKGDSLFCYSQYIDPEQRRIFTKAGPIFAKPIPTLQRMAALLAWLASELNALHPFREGNGRAIRTFLILVARDKSYYLDYSTAPPEQRIAADIEAFHGNLKPLNSLYQSMLSKFEE